MTALSQIRTSTGLLAVFGDPVEHSLSPAMHNAAITDLGLDLVYMAFRVGPASLRAALEGVRSMGIIGVNLTIPLKEVGCALVDELAEDASDAGAVNTVVNKNGTLVGHNTDGQGFVASMSVDLGLSATDLNVCVIGAGGAARGVSLSLARSGAASIVFACRNKKKAELLRDLVRARCCSCRSDVVSLADCDAMNRVLESTDFLINATPVGMYPRVGETIDIDLGLLQSDACVADLIYNPFETVLLKRARARGLKTMNGIGMLAHQGALAFELWTGEMPDVNIMRQALMQCLVRG